MTSLNQNDPTPTRGRVLVIDDDQVDQMMCQRTLKRSNLFCEILSFTDATKALTYLREADAAQIGLILLDVNLPRMSGAEFLAAALEDADLNFSTAVAIMVSTALPKEQREWFAAMSCVKAFIDKPLKIDDVKSALPLFHRTQSS